MNVETLLVTMLGSLVGGAGLVGLVFAYIRRFIDNKLKTREEINAKRRAQRTKRLNAEDELERANGRLLYYVCKDVSASPGEHEDLKAAWAEYQEVERQVKAVEREILVENEMEV